VLVLTCALNVAPGDFGRARIRADERLHIRVALSTLEDLHWGNEQALLKQIGCVATVGSGDFPAKVGLVGDVADECGQPFAREYRRDHGDVGRMILAGLIGVIDDESVTGMDCASETPANFVHLRRERSDMQGLGNALRHHAALAIKDGKREVLAFLDDR